MEWSGTVVPGLVAAAVLLIPGLLVTLSVGVRGLPAIAAAPSVSVGIVGVAAIAAGAIHMSWSPLPVAITTVAACLLFGMFRGVISHTRPAWDEPVHPRGTRRYRPWVPAAALLVAAVIIGARFAQIFGRPDSISQTFDNVFHLNAVRYILDTHDGSSLTIAAITSGDQPPSFYPAAWHDLVALVAGLTRVQIPVAVNATNIAIGTLVWPLSVLLLATTVRRFSSVGLVLAGVVSTAFAGFPYLLLDFGVLYPNFLAYALVPSLLAVLAAVFGLPSALRRPEAIALVLPAAAGAALAHPNGLMTTVAMGAPIVLASLLRHRRALREAGQSSRRVTVGHLGLLVLAAASWAVVRPPRDQITWEPVQNFAQAAGEGLFNDGMGRPTSLLASALTVTGAWFLAARRSRSSWLVGSWVIALVLFVIVSGTSLPHIRAAATGVWYNDSFRLAAALPLVAAPLAAVGCDVLLTWLVRWRTRRRAVPGRVLTAVSASLLILLAVFGTQSTGVPAEIHMAASTYRATANASLLSSDELRLIEALPQYVPSDATIAVDAWTGGALAYALADRNVTYRHIYSSSTADTRLIDAELRNARPGSAVCEAAAREHVEFILDFGSSGVFGPTTLPPGLSNLESSSAVTEVARTGPQAVLYRLTGCS